MKSDATTVTQEHVAEGIIVGGVWIKAGSTQGRPEGGRMDRNDGPQTARVISAVQDVGMPITVR